MKNKVKRTILLLSIALILFLITVFVPALQGSEWKVILQGAATGFTMAAIIVLMMLVIDYLKENKTRA